MAVLSEEHLSQEIELLIPEVERETRKRRRRWAIRTVGSSIVVVGLLAAVLSVAHVIGGGPGSTSPTQVLPPARGAVPVNFTGDLKPAMVVGQLVSCPGDVCVVIGSGSGRPPANLIARLYTSRGWSTLPSPIGLQSVQLQGLSCTTASSCALVGYDWTPSPRGLTRGFAEILRNGHWAITTPPVPASQSSSLTAVSCPSSSWCMATGADWTGSANQLFAAVWNGARWRTVSVPLPADAFQGAPAQLSGLSCVGAGWCMGVGSYGRRGATGPFLAATGPLVEQWFRGSWRLANAPPIVGAARFPRTEGGTVLRLESVTCIARSWCAVSGTDSAGDAFEPTGTAELAIWKARTWTTVLGSSWRLYAGPHSASWRDNPRVGPREAGLGAISCSSTVRCVTYITPNSIFGPPANSPLTLFEHDGRGWFAVNAPTIANVAQTASDVACMRSGTCLIVGTEMRRSGGTSEASGAFVYGTAAR